MNFIPPDFSSWPIFESLKALLLQEDEWPDYFAMNSDNLTMILNSFSVQIQEVNFFNNFAETELFFNFLSALVESKPQDNNVLKEFSDIMAVILDKLSLESDFNSKQANVAIEYLKLLSLMLKPDYRYLFEKPEISLWTNDFQKISNHTFRSSALLSHFHNTLLLSFQSRSFIRNYPILIQTLRDLAYSLDKGYVSSHALEAMKLFDSLGVLAHTLESSRIRKIVDNLTMINQSIQDGREHIFNLFEPYVEKNFLKFIVYKLYLTQRYPDSANLSELCDSENYQAQCTSDYIRYNDNYHCAIDRFPNFSIDIKSNNRANRSLEHLCTGMRNSEWFVSWLDAFGFERNYNASQFNLYLADSVINFREDKLLFENDDPLEKDYTVLATYYPAQKRSQIGLGSAFSATDEPSYVVHEHNHHLFSQYIPDLELDLTMTEGIAELFSGGICSEKNINDLRNFVNDTSIFKFFEARKYPFYFNALKWVAYLINEQTELFKIFVNKLQKNDTENFYSALDNFINNTSNVRAFVNWSHQQVTTCNDYISLFPDGQASPHIYLADVKRILNQTHTTSSPVVNYSNILRDFLYYSGQELNEYLIPSTTEKAKSDSDEFSQQMKIGIPLPLVALFAGFTSVCFDEMSLAYKDKYPSVPAYINYGVKPLAFALMNAGLNALLFDQKVELGDEKIARIFCYFMMNFLSVFFGQSMTKKLAEKIHNKLLCFLVQTLTWTLLWNPSLFLSQDSKLLPTLFLQLIQGLCFKVGEEVCHLTKKCCFSSNFWRQKRQETMVAEEDSLSNPIEMQVSNLNFIR